jgi:hypothetical protein
MHRLSIFPKQFQWMSPNKVLVNIFSKTLFYFTVGTSLTAVTVQSNEKYIAGTHFIFKCPTIRNHTNRPKNKRIFCNSFTWFIFNLHLEKYIQYYTILYNLQQLCVGF